MSERLEDIIEQLVMNAKLKIEDVNWLIEQVERLSDLEEGLRLNIKIKQEGIDFLKQENKRYREALEFYANKDNYKLEHFDPNLNDYMSTVDYDEGKTARNALEGEE